MSTIGVIEVHVALYLETDVTEEEAKNIVDTMGYSFRHKLISNSDLYHYDLLE